MGRLQDDADALRFEPLLEELRDLLGEPFLDLEAAGVHLDHARDLGQPDDTTARDVRHRRRPEERQEVVLAQRVERDVPHDDHLAVRDVEDRAVDEPLGIDVVTGGQLCIHPVDAAGRPGEALAVRILTDLHQDLADGGLDRTMADGLPGAAPLDGRLGADRLVADLVLDLVDDALDVDRQIGRAGQRRDSRCRPRWYVGHLLGASAVTEIVPPEQPRRDGAPRSPGFTELGQLRRVRPVPETFHVTDRRRKRDVADGPDIGPPEDHQEIDRRGPRTDARDRLQGAMDGVVVEATEPVEVERARLDGSRQRSAIPRLLATEPDREELRVTQLEESRRGERIRSRVQPVEGRSCGRERDLLFEDDMQQRRKPGFTIPERRQTVAGHDGSKIRVARRKFVDRGGESRGG